MNPAAATWCLDVCFDQREGVCDCESQCDTWRDREVTICGALIAYLNMLFALSGSKQRSERECFKMETRN